MHTIYFHTATLACGLRRLVRSYCVRRTISSQQPGILARPTQGLPAPWSGLQSAAGWIPLFVHSPAFTQLASGSSCSCMSGLLRLAITLVCACIQEFITPK
eukprot:scpid104740/ scgid12444/ 